LELGLEVGDFVIQHNFKKVSISDALFQSYFKYKNVNFKIYGIHLKFNIIFVFMKNIGILKCFKHKQIVVDFGLLGHELAKLTQF
jgi:hypothetical protein